MNTGVYFTNLFQLGFLECLKYICAMRILQSIIIFSFFFFASNPCNAGIFESAPIEVIDLHPGSEKTNLGDSYSPKNLNHFYKRTEQESYFHPSHHDFAGQLFLRFGKSNHLLNQVIPCYHFCTSIGLLLIFPKHYFY